MSTGVAVKIRPARLNEADALAETAIAAWREGFRGIVPKEIDPAYAWSTERIAARLDGTSGDSSEILSAAVDGEVRGLILLGPHCGAGSAPYEGEVIALYVHPVRWRQGVGRALIEAGLDRLAQSGYRQAVVWTLAESSRNLAFYEALGFRRDGATQRRPSFGSPLEVRFRIALAR